MRRRLPVGLLLLSGALHAAALVGVMAAFGGTTPAVLFVDLVHGIGVGGDVGSGGGGSPAATAAEGRGARAPAAGATHKSARVSEPSATVRPHRRAVDRTSAPASAPSMAADQLVVPREPEPAIPFVLTPPPPVDSAAFATAPPPTGQAPADSDGTASSPSALEGTGTAVTSGADGRGGASDRGTTLGQGGPGSGGGQGTGVGPRPGDAVSLALPGAGGGEAAEYDGYYALLRLRLHEVLKYPLLARRRGLAGTVHIDVDIAPTGAVGTADVIVSSSHRLLDDAALEAVRSLGRVPFPPGVRPRALRVRLPVVFNLR